MRPIVAGLVGAVLTAGLAVVAAQVGQTRGVVDLVGTLGAYKLMAMMMVVDEFPLPDGVKSELGS
jgi:hypothetical protein